jgi:hypothetical protein
MKEGCRKRKRSSIRIDSLIYAEISLNIMIQTFPREEKGDRRESRSIPFPLPFQLRNKMKGGPSIIDKSDHISGDKTK